MTIYILFVDGYFRTPHVSRASAEIERSQILAVYPTATIYIGTDILARLTAC